MSSLSKSGAINDVVITGMSGRFPMSDTIDEFARNLYEGRDLITDDHNRWSKDLFGMNARIGVIGSCDRFDAAFFGQLGADLMDPQIRMLLEVVYEAIVDAGQSPLFCHLERVHPQQLRGTQTGVYVGWTGLAGADGLPNDLQPDLNQTAHDAMQRTLGHTTGIFANRISFVYDLKGPSVMCDSVCSASFAALSMAVNDILLGHVDTAVVCGTCINLQPILAQTQQVLGVCSPRGVSAPMDARADGYVKADAVCAVLLQRRPDARRIYASVRAVRLNVDGFKTEGMYRPSGAAQEALMVRTYTDAGVDPSKLSYAELHCAGTQAGDFTEINAVCNAYCKPTARTERLPLGAVKSNMGHAEGTAGLVSLIKVLIAYENQCIPPNINLSELRKDLEPLLSIILPVVKPHDYDPGLAAVNSFGIGGANGHVLLEPNYKLATSDGHINVADIMPRIVNICGRSEESVKYIMDFIENNPKKITNDFLALLAQTMKYTPNVNSSGMTFRGSIIIKRITKEINGEIKYEYKKQMGVMTEKTRRPLWVLFPGLGGQWSAMAKALMPIKTFADTIEECHQTVHKEFGIDLKHILLSEDKTAISTMTAKFVATTAIEIALFAVIKDLDITPDGIIGHSFGELACGFADGCLDARGAMLYTALRAINSVQNVNIPKGLMAVVGLSRAQARTYCPNGVYIACNNGKDNVVITGPMNEMLNIIKELKAKGVFVRPLDCDEIPYHSPYISESAKAMKEAINTYVPNPKLRSEKWLSTSVFRSELEDKRLAYGGGEYFEHNMVNEVRFHDQLQTLPADAIVLELGPHSVFKQIVSETLPNSLYISLIKKDSNAINMDMFLSGMAQLYELGFNLAIDRLYAPVEWPVARNTPSISALIKWDHSERYSVKNYHDNYCKTTSSDTIVVINHKHEQDAFYMEHVINGQPVIPVSGYIMMAWRKVAASVGKLWTECPVVFENIALRRAVFLSDRADTKLVVKYFAPTGETYIYNNDELCVTCRATATDGGETETWRQMIADGRPAYAIDRPEMYGDLRALGVDNGPAFQRLRYVRCDDTFSRAYGRCEWTGNPVAYMGDLLQSVGLLWPRRAGFMPVSIGVMRLDPRALFAAVWAERLTAGLAPTIMTPTPGECHPDIVTQCQNNEFSDRFAQFSADIPFCYDSHTRRLVSPGVEVDDITAQPMPTRHDSNLTLESYEFCPNDDMAAIDDTMRAEMLQYIEVCESMAVKLNQSGVKCDSNNTDITQNAIQNGRRADTGQRVMGVAPEGRCLATNVYAPITHMTPIPDHWSMAEAATILSSYCTVYYGLIKRAHIVKGESVLIHYGGGGVGEAAINVCQHYGCDIYATVGTDEERLNLIARHNIPAKRIVNADSDCHSNGRLMSETGGRGVHLVVNTQCSASDDVLGMECLSSGGRFVELCGQYGAKLPIVMASDDRDVQYTRVAPNTIAKQSVEFMADFYRWIDGHSSADNGCVRPLNHTAFAVTEVVDAFRLMTTTIEKVIVKFRDEESDRRPPVSITPALAMPVTRKTYFNPHKVYIITGGLGGMGLELLPWLHCKGARKFAITSRRGLTTDYQKFFINRVKRIYNNTNTKPYIECDFIISTANALTIESAKQLLSEAQELGPIGGVFHLALVLNESLAENMTIDKFAETADTKHRVFENLDQLTRGLDYKLDHFVVFSSISTGKGNAGQCNYGYGNSVCERLCERRRRDGMHGLAVQYGPIGDVGVFEGRQEYESLTACRKQRVLSAVDVLDKLLATDYPIVTSQIFDDNRCGDRSATRVGSGGRLIGELWSVLGVDPNTTPDGVTIGEIGLESMFAIQLQNEFRDRLDMNVPLAHLKGLTVGMFKAYAGGDPEPIRQYAMARKSGHSSAQRRRLVVPTERYVRLNAVSDTTGRAPVFFLPPLALNFAGVAPLAERLERPVIGLNWTREVSALTTVEAVGDYYIALIVEINGEINAGRLPYDVCSFFDMAPVCGRLLSLATGLGRAVIVDITPDRRLFDARAVADEFMVAFMMKQLATECSPQVLASIEGRVRAEREVSGQQAIVTASMPELTRQAVVAPHMGEIFGIMLARIAMFFDHKSNKSRRTLTDVVRGSVAEKWAQYSGKLIEIKPFAAGAVLEMEDTLDVVLGVSHDDYI
ncbi:unnamed protein product, partial [Medioppia subpectinata]